MKSETGRRGRALHASLLVLLVVPFAVPLLRPGWIQSHEGVSYPIRLVELARCWADGHWSARWFPDMYVGQGFPFLSFYAPLFFFVAGLFHWLGASVPLALKLPVLLGTVAGAAGAYRMARLATGPAGATVAAALYTYAPYRVREIWIRGDLTEYVAAGLLPWSLLAVLRLREHRSVRDVVLVAVAGALPIVTHNILGMFTGMMMAMTAAWVVALSEDRIRAGWAGAAGGAGALILSAFFWVPALYEKRFVRIEEMTTGALDIWNNFVGPVDFFRWPEVPGVGQGLPMSFELGYPALALLLLFAWSSRRLPRGARPVVAVCLSLVGVGVVMTTALGTPLYRSVPVFRFVQFPWRFLTLVSLGAAVLGGIGLGAVLSGARPAVRNGAAALAAALAVATVWPILGPKDNFEIPAWTIDPTEIAKTRQTTTSSDEYLPIWVTREPRIPKGFDRGVKFEGAASLEGTGRRVAAYRFTVRAEEPVTVLLRDLYYPGWTGTVNGAPLSLSPREGTGEIQFALGPGTHEIRAWLAPTGARRTAWTVSAAAALLALIAWGVGGRSNRARRPTRGYFSAGPHG